MSKQKCLAIKYEMCIRDRSKTGLLINENTTKYIEISRRTNNTDFVTTTYTFIHAWKRALMSYFIQKIMNSLDMISYLWPEQH